MANLMDPWSAGIIAEEIVEAMPPELEALSDRLVRWGIVPKAIRPNSAIINVYEPGDCIPPHIDHHDFVRPFVTLSLLSEQPIMFGQRLIPLSPGNFGGSDYYIRLPQGGPYSLSSGLAAAAAETTTSAHLKVDDGAHTNLLVASET